MPRLFVAVPLSPEVRQNLAAVRRDDIKKLRWVAEHQYHVTLRFLGDVTEEEADAVGDAVHRVVSQWPRVMHLRAKGIGAFPNAARARVIWAGCEGDVALLTDLHRQLEQALKTRGFALETRRFHPHITLARRRQPGPVPAALQPYAEHDFGGWDVTEVQVIESILRPTGPQYVVRRAVTIGGL